MSFLPPPEDVLCVKKEVEEKGGKNTENGEENGRKMEKGRKRDRNRAGNSDDKRFTV